ncbi:MAG: PEGA domain-containing protein, partial [candidate division WOR-3 bacterium]
ITKLESLLNTNKPNLSLIANLPKQSILRGVNKPKFKTLIIYLASIIVFTIAISVWYKISKSSKVVTTAQIEKPNFLSSQETVLITKPNINQTAKETMLTIIPDKKNSILPQNSINNETGSVKISVLPWATVFIDGKEIFTTPKDTIINLVSGTHIIKLINPNFPIIESIINIKPAQQHTVLVDLNEHIGYLQIIVHPWADIYINDEYKTTTPTSSPLILPIGKYELTLKNPYFSPYTETIFIKPKQTIERNIILK